MRFLFCILVLAFGFIPLPAQATPVPRVVIALYDSHQAPEPRKSPVHIYAEMPLNHLGLVLRYHDIQKLPPPPSSKEVRGILAWTLRTPDSPYSKQWLAWAVKEMERGKRFVLVGDDHFWMADLATDAATQTLSSRWLALMGLRGTGKWFYPLDLQRMTFPVKVPEMTDFERPVSGNIAIGVRQLLPTGETSLVPLLAGKVQEDRTILLGVSDRGGMAVNGLAIYNNLEVEPEIRQWMINPFAFFRAAFATDDLPKPDVTTQTGNRLYFSHIDGDGWNNGTLVEPYKKDSKLCSEIVLDKAVKDFPDMPVAMALIAGDVDREWGGTAHGIAVARDFLAQPQVEVSSHTYSHPFDWSFFEHYDRERERPLLPKFQGTSWMVEDALHTEYHGMNRLRHWFDSKVLGNNRNIRYSDDYELPRAYARTPFSLEREMTGARFVIESLAPPGKKVKLLQWSGNTRPYEEAIAMARRGGMFNMNGGDTRFDKDYPSNAWVSPVGITVGEEQQIYAASSNENTYTNTWLEMFHAFRYLRETMQRTESPRRIKPFNIYYHIYSGQYEASIKALVQNIAYAHRLPLARIRASDYTAIANGFYQTELVSVGDRHWRVRHRGDLQTIRFDNAEKQFVNWQASKGVLGSNRHQGSLYVALDPAVEEPEIVLSDTAVNPSSPVLQQSRWPVRNVRTTGRGIRFLAGGYGSAEMVWQVPDRQGKWQIRNAAGAVQATMTAADNRLLTVRFETAPVTEAQSWTLERVTP